MRPWALLLCACGALPQGDQLTRLQAYDAIRPADCEHLARCAPDQFARDYASQEACIAAKRPKFPRSAEISDCSRDEVTACVNAENTEPCHVGAVAACEGC